MRTRDLKPAIIRGGVTLMAAMAALALNLFLAAGRTEKGFPSLLVSIVEEMSPEGQRVIARRIVTRGNRLLSARQRVLTRRLAVDEKAAEPSFDRDAVKAAMGEMRAEFVDIFAEVREVFLDTLEVLPVEDRQLFARTMAERMRAGMGTPPEFEALTGRSQEQPPPAGLSGYAALVKKLRRTGASKQYLPSASRSASAWNR